MTRGGGGGIALNGGPKIVAETANTEAKSRLGQVVGFEGHGGRNGKQREAGVRYATADKMAVSQNRTPPVCLRVPLGILRPPSA